MPVAVSMSLDLMYAVVASQEHRRVLTVIHAATGKAVSRVDVPRPRERCNPGTLQSVHVAPDPVALRPVPTALTVVPRPGSDPPHPDLTHPKAQTSAAAQLLAAGMVFRGEGECAENKFRSLPRPIRPSLKSD